MPRNNYFQFKKFKIIQEKSAMKVGVDGVLLGAWANVCNAKRMLDIGTGTGLIALMLAQKNQTAKIDAIEIDKNAFCEAEINIGNSSWADRIVLFHTSFQEYVISCNHKYDLIVSNPPFFNKGVSTNSNSRNIARKAEFLPLNIIISGASEILSVSGKIILILPFESMNEIKNLVSINNLYLSRICYVKPNPLKTVFRIIVEITKFKSELKTEDLIIEFEKHHDYTPDYMNLTKDFYLKF